MQPHRNQILPVLLYRGMKIQTSRNQEPSEPKPKIAAPTTPHTITVRRSFNQPTRLSLSLFLTKINRRWFSFRNSWNGQRTAPSSLKFSSQPCQPNECSNLTYLPCECMMTQHHRTKQPNPTYNILTTEEWKFKPPLTASLPNLRSQLLPLHTQLRCFGASTPLSHQNNKTSMIQF
jgi:hypothetical protein